MVHSVIIFGFERTYFCAHVHVCARRDLLSLRGEKKKKIAPLRGGFEEQELVSGKIERKKDRPLMGGFRASPFLSACSAQDVIQ